MFICPHRECLIEKYMGFVKCRNNLYSVNIVWWWLEDEFILCKSATFRLEGRERWHWPPGEERE